MKIALVEDDKTTAVYIKDLLEDRGYKVEIFGRGSEALDFFKKKRYNLIILDVNLPDMNGFDICSSIKKNPEIYNKPKILILSERKKQPDVNRGLEIGADDYVKKPFDSKELLLRVKKLSEASVTASLHKIEYKEITIDFDQNYIVEERKKIDFTKKEIEILYYLFLNKNLIVTKDKMYLEIWDEDYIKGNKKLEVYIGKIKKKSKCLKENILTYKNMGYKLIS